MNKTRHTVCHREQARYRVFAPAGTHRYRVFRVASCHPQTLISQARRTAL